ncbi:MAG: hypothetical protein K6A75_11015 [Ruminococcus sp.]|nr:hypothetical protein [Ruminococcus sp.]
MAERDIQNEITASENKTYAYFNSVMCSLASGNFLIFVLSCIGTLMRSSNIDDVTGMPVDPDFMDKVIQFGFIAFVSLMLAIFFAWRWYRRICVLEKKAATILISLAVYVVLIPILDYISLLIYGLILWK